MKKMLFVMNPYAGTRQGVRYLADVIAIFNRADYEVLTYMTGGQGDAKRIVAKKAKDMDLVVCAGGDGTFNEAVSGILESAADVPLGYIPCGSTNDFAASLGLSANILKAAQEIVDGAPVQYDMGLFGNRYFSYVASFGAFTRASYATPQNIKNALGHVAYILSGISELSQIRKEKIRIELGDQVIEDEFLFGAVSNSTSMGGIFNLDPKQVDMKDGKFELLLVRAPKNLAEIGECLQALQTQKYNCGMITFLSTDALRVCADPDMPWTLDGEREDGHEQVQIRCLPLALKLMKKE